MGNAGHLAGLRSAANSLSTRQSRARTGFITAACLTVCQVARASCAGPASLETRIQAHPDASAYAALGEWFGQHHQAECAVEAYRSGIKRVPEPAQLDLRLGAALAQLGRNREALLAWQAALNLDPSSKAALDGQAKSLIAAGDYQAVIRSLSNAARDESMTLDLALAYRKIGLLDRAEQSLNEGLRADPGSDALTAALVSLLVDESHYEAATALAEKIAGAKPDDLEAQRIYFRTLVVTGDNDRATALGRKLLQLKPHDADLLNLNGLLEKRGGDYTAARKHLEEAVALNPNDYNQRVNLGVVLIALNDPAGAKIQLQKALALGTDEPQVHFELARVLRTLGQTAEAQRQLAIYQQKLKQESDRTFAVAKAAEAAQAAKAGENQRAADLYRQACAAQPNDAAMAYQWALVLDSLGDADGERAALQQAIHADSHYVLAQYQLGYLDYHSGDNAGAERQFRLTVGEVPDNPQAWISLAAALGAESRFNEAQQALAHALRLDPNNGAALNLKRQLADGQSQQRGTQ